MKTNRFYAHPGTLGVLVTCLLSASALHAQTFNGQPKMADSPTHLEATVFPLTNRPSTLKVIFNNPTGGSVRVVIRDEKGKVCYDELEAITLYRRNFDLSPMSPGKYTVELSKQNEHIVRAFAIEPSTMSHIALIDPADQKTPDQLADKKLIVNH